MNSITNLFVSPNNHNFSILWKILLSGQPIRQIVTLLSKSIFTLSELSHYLDTIPNKDNNWEIIDALEDALNRQTISNQDLRHCCILNSRSEFEKLWCCAIIYKNNDVFNSIYNYIEDGNFTQIQCNHMIVNLLQSTDDDMTDTRIKLLELLENMGGCIDINVSLPIMMGSFYKKAPMWVHLCCGVSKNDTWVRDIIEIKRKNYINPAHKTLALYYAIYSYKNNCSAMLDMLCSIFNENINDTIFGASLLHHAVMTNNPMIVGTLVNAGADGNSLIGYTTKLFNNSKLYAHSDIISTLTVNRWYRTWPAPRSSKDSDYSYDAFDQCDDFEDWDKARTYARGAWDWDSLRNPITNPI